MVADPTKLTRVINFYLAKNLDFNSVQRLDVTEDIAIIKVSPKKALAMVETGEIWSSGTVAALLLANLKFPNLFKIDK